MSPPPGDVQDGVEGVHDVVVVGCGDWKVGL